MSKEIGITWWELSLNHLTVVKALCEPMQAWLWLILHGCIPMDSFWRLHNWFSNFSMYQIRAQLLLALLRLAYLLCSCDRNCLWLSWQLYVTGLWWLHLPTTLAGGWHAWLFFVDLWNENRTDIRWQFSFPNRQKGHQLNLASINPFLKPPARLRYFSLMIVRVNTLL
jgi:hypothetical protein